jgi:beta-N-acetylglucosaminidase
MKKLIIINIVLVVLVVFIPKITKTQEETTGLIHNQSVTSRGEVERQPVKSYSLTIDMDLRKKSNLTADDYNAMLSGTKLKCIGSALEKAEQQYNINGLYLLGLCCLESGYGTSSYAVNRNNLVRMERS